LLLLSAFSIALPTPLAMTETGRLRLRLISYASPVSIFDLVNSSELEKPTARLRPKKSELLLGLTPVCAVKLFSLYRKRC
jgi:hypothetical protein